MKYKNMIFDFGNVIGKFNGMYILKQFCESEEDCQLLASVVYEKWNELDKGTIDYNEYIEQTIDKIPDRLEDTVRTFFRDWPHHLLPIEDTLRFIDELKAVISRSTCCQTRLHISRTGLLHMSRSGNLTASYFPLL